MHLTKKTLDGLAWLLVGTGAQMILKIIVLMIMARLLTPADFGVVGAATIFISLSLLLSKIGVGPALVQRHNLTCAHIQAGFISSLGFTLLVGILIFSGANWIGNIFRMDQLSMVVAVLALVLPLTGLGIVSEALLQREFRFRSLALIEVCSYAVGYGAIGIVLASFGLGVWALVGAQIGQDLCKTLLLVIVRPFPVIGCLAPLRIYRDLYGYGAGYSFANMAQFAANQGDNFVVGRWMGAEALGIYSRSFQALTMPTNLLGAAAEKVLFPTMTSIQGEQDRLARGVRIAIAALAMVSLPMSAFLMILAPEIVDIMLGSQWHAVIIPFQILSIGIVFRVGYKIFQSVAQAKGAVYQLAWRQWIYAVLVFIGAWGGHFWGLPGVALGVTMAIIISYLLVFELVARLADVSWFDVSKTMARHGLITVFIGVTVWMIVNQARAHIYNSLVVLALGAISGTGVIIFLCILCKKIFGDEAILVFSMVRDRLNSIFHNFVKNASQVKPDTKEP